MQQDEVIWQVINRGFCSFKSKVAKERNFCTNPMNVTGLCLRSACPLANSRYATIREEDGKLYLYIKTIERAHTPKNLWEKIKLPQNYTKALEVVTEQLQYFPIYLQHRNKQRLTKIHQYLINMRKLKLKARPKLVAINTHVEKLERRRERAALKAADLERNIEKELLERLKQASEGDIFNYPEREYSRALAKASEEYNEQEGEEEEEEDDEVTVEYVEDLEESDEEADIEDAAWQLPEAEEAEAQEAESSTKRSAKRKQTAGKRAQRKPKGPRVEVEYEFEDEFEEQKELERNTRANAGRSASSTDMQFNF